MQVAVYHEVRPEFLNEVLQEGLKCGDHGEKSDEVTLRTDECLDSRIPSELAAAGLSRRNVVYGYLSAGDRLFDIRSGQAVDVDHFASERDLVLLRIAADPAHCFVSDLDAYDAVKMCVKSGADESLLSRLAERYWARVLALDEYRTDHNRRPEVMMVGDVAAGDITVVPV